MFAIRPWEMERLTVDQLLRRVAYIDRANEQVKEVEQEREQVRRRR